MLRFCSGHNLSVRQDWGTWIIHVNNNTIVQVVVTSIFMFSGFSLVCSIVCAYEIQRLKVRSSRTQVSSNSQCPSWRRSLELVPTPLFWRVFVLGTSQLSCLQSARDSKPDILIASPIHFIPLNQINKESHILLWFGVTGASTGTELQEIK